MKVGFSIKWDIKKKETRETAKKVLFSCMLKLHELAVIYCPVDKGRLVNSIKVYPTSPGYSNYILFTPVEYAAANEFGTSPYIIKPSSKKALKFKSGTNTIFSKSVMHPGIKATPYFRPALIQVKNVWIERYWKMNLSK